MYVQCCLDSPPCYSCPYPGLEAQLCFSSWLFFSMRGRLIWSLHEQLNFPSLHVLVRAFYDATTPLSYRRISSIWNNHPLYGSEEVRTSSKLFPLAHSQVRQAQLSVLWLPEPGRSSVWNERKLSCSTIVSVPVPSHCILPLPPNGLNELDTSRRRPALRLKFRSPACAYNWQWSELQQCTRIAPLGNREAKDRIMTSIERATSGRNGPGP